MKHAIIILVLLLLYLVPRVQGQTGAWPVCDQTVHDAARYRATGPDGQSYATWHPQYDGYAQCVFTHEHGSDPALILPGYRPLYGYSARMMPETHNGFKGYAFRAGGYSWYLTQHQGTGNAALAACARFHTLDILAVDDLGVAADLHLMGDFGRAVANETGQTLATNCQQVQGNGTGIRQFPIASMGNVGYEPWRAGEVAPFVHLQNATFTALNPVTACDTVLCTVALTRANALGTHRILTVYAGFGVTANATYSNTFTFDVHGMSAQQYIRTELDARVSDAVALYPHGAQSYWYAPQYPGYDAYPFQRNPFVTGVN